MTGPLTAAAAEPLVSMLCVPGLPLLAEEPFTTEMEQFQAMLYRWLWATNRERSWTWDIPPGQQTSSR